MPRHKPIEEEAKSVVSFDGIVNAKRTKDIGHKALVTGRNVEVTDTKRLTRRDGRTLVTADTFAALYGTDAQNRVYGVKGGVLYDIDRDDNLTQLATGLVGDIYSWDEDPNNNVYY